MFKVKICGVRDPDTAVFCSSVGVGAIGLNFYEKSRRFIDENQARRIVDAIGDRLCKVGLFVNHDVSHVVELATKLSLDAIQLHGDETPAFLEELVDLPGSVRVIRAIRIARTNESAALGGIEAWSSNSESNRVCAILLDPFVDHAYGGTGKTIDWDWLAGIQLPTDKPIVLAGGLNAENVADAIAAVRPHGVDVAGGVENEKGEKDRQKIQDFTLTALRSIERA